jgi:hypothetical protein
MVWMWIGFLVLLIGVIIGLMKKSWKAALKYMSVIVLLLFVAGVFLVIFVYIETASLKQAIAAEDVMFILEAEGTPVSAIRPSVEQPKLISRDVINESDLNASYLFILTNTSFSNSTKERMLSNPALSAEDQTYLFAHILGEELDKTKGTYLFIGYMENRVSIEPDLHSLALMRTIQIPLAPVLAVMTGGSR